MSGKRLFDVILAIAGLILVIPATAIISVLLWIDSPGSLIYAQERVGRHGKRFFLYKFRKFPDGLSDSGPGVTVAGDARMTRIGQILERTKLDELPQLWNILKGDMSFVGPRPESVRYQELFHGEMARVLDYLPGIFGPNQVIYRNESHLYPMDQNPDDYYRNVLFPEKARRDIAYFKKATFSGDIVWIIQGTWATLIGVFNWRRMIGLHALIVTIDLFSIQIAWLLANFLRFGTLAAPDILQICTTGLWLIPAILLPAMIMGGVYRHPVRSVSVCDIARLSVVVSIGWGLAYLFLLGLYHRDTSISLLPIGGIILISTMIGVRVWHRERFRKRLRTSSKYRKGMIGIHASSRILIYGAGQRGTAFAILIENGFPEAALEGFIDDSEELRGRYIMGYKILGGERDLSTVHTMIHFNEIWVTFQPDEKKRYRLENWCKEKGIKISILPEIQPFSTLQFSSSCQHPACS